MKHYFVVLTIFISVGCSERFSRLEPIERHPSGLSIDGAPMEALSEEFFENAKDPEWIKKHSFSDSEIKAIERSGGNLSSALAQRLDTGKGVRAEWR